MVYTILKGAAYKFFVVLIPLSLTLGIKAQADFQTAKFNIRALGIDLGEMTVTQVSEGEEVIVEATSEVEVNFIFTFEVRYVQYCKYRSGELLESSLKTYKKGEVNSDTRLTKVKDGYVLEKDGEVTVINDRITYSGSMLYFNEPKDVDSMYIEMSGAKDQVKHIGAHVYEVLDTESGRKRTYEYEGGKLVKTEIHYRLATIRTEKIKDSSVLD
jgi:hypothetical protein